MVLNIENFSTLYDNTNSDKRKVTHDGYEYLKLSLILQPHLSSSLSTIFQHYYYITVESNYTISKPSPKTRNPTAYLHETIWLIAFSHQVALHIRI